MARLALIKQLKLVCELIEREGQIPVPFVNKHVLIQKQLPCIKKYISPRKLNQGSEEHKSEN